MVYLKRKIDLFLRDWKNKEDHKPLVIKGARQVGKTSSILEFAKENYKSYIYINFFDNPKYKNIFNDSFDPKDIVKNITAINQKAEFIEGNTLIVFDEIQEYPDAMTSLKFFNLEKKYDVICSGSLLGINYKSVTSVSVGNQEEYEMNSMDFEEFLWAKGRDEKFINEIFDYIYQKKELPKVLYDILEKNWEEYIIVSGMPSCVSRFIETNTYTSVLENLHQIVNDYKADMKKYVFGFDKMKLENTFNSAVVQLGKENKKFQISKIKSGARNKDYIDCVEWLCDVGILAKCYAIENLELPLKGNYDINKYKLYFRDSGILLSSLDDEVRENFIIDKQRSTYKGGIFENIVAESLYKSGIDLFYFKKENSTLEEDFIVRTKNNIVPIEVKSKKGLSKSLRALIDGVQYKEIDYGIKIMDRNILYDNNILVLPHFVTFLIKRLLKEL